MNAIASREPDVGEVVRRSLDYWVDKIPDAQLMHLSESLSFQALILVGAQLL